MFNVVLILVVSKRLFGAETMVKENGLEFERRNGLNCEDYIFIRMCSM